MQYNVNISSKVYSKNKLWDTMFILTYNKIITLTCFL